MNKVFMTMYILQYLGFIWAKTWGENRKKNWTYGQPGSVGGKLKSDGVH